MNKFLLAAAVAVASPAMPAETKTPIAIATSAIHGVEVETFGTISITPFGPRPAYFTERGGKIYQVEFAVDRKTLDQLRSCEGRDRGCAADISAEIRVEGGDIKLIIFAVRNLVSTPAQ